MDAGLRTRGAILPTLSKTQMGRVSGCQPLRAPERVASTACFLSYGRQRGRPASEGNCPVRSRRICFWLYGAGRGGRARDRAICAIRASRAAVLA
jgi:hypothetical protein